MLGRPHKLRRQAGELEEASDRGLGEDEEGKEEGERLACAVCGRIVALERYGFTIDGSARHERVNPGGHRFRFRCFSRTQGLVGHGDWVAEHTWFAGYRWKIMLCGGCGVHLGWAFDGVSPFWALIEDRLTRG